MAQATLFSRCDFDVQLIRFAAWCVGAVALLPCAAGASAAQPSQAPEPLEQREAQELTLIHAAVGAGMEPLKLGRLWSHLATVYADTAEFPKAEDAYNHALKEFRAAPDGAKEYAVALDNLGSLYLIEGNLVAAENCGRQAMDLYRAAGDRLEMAIGESHLAEVSLARKRYKDAEQQALEAWREMGALKDSSPIDRIVTGVALTYASAMNRQGEEAVSHGREALALARASFAGNSMPVAQARMSLGVAEWKAGRKNEADQDMRGGIQELRAWVAPGHPDLLAALKQYSRYLNETHRKREAQQIAEEEKRQEMLPPQACANCTVSAYGLR